MEGFELILDADESIIKTYKPNKKRFVLLGLVSCLPSLIFPGLIIMFAVLGLNGIISVTDDAGNPDYSGPIIMLIFGGIIALFLLIGAFYPVLRYKKALYCITNKRIIIRHGIIGADFKSLNLKDISTVLVEVNFLDKFVKPNTGTIRFGSAATPMLQGNQKNGYVPFAFQHVDNPYETYREVKTYVDAATINKI